MSIKSLNELLEENSQQKSLTKEQKLLNWLETAKPGAMYIYHIGASFNDGLLLWRLKQVAWEKAVEGQVILLRRHIATDLYEYLIQKPYALPLSKRLVPDDYGKR